MLLHVTQNSSRHLPSYHLLMKLVLIMGNWKVCPCLRNEYWFGLNGGMIWYKAWFGLLAMALRRPASAVPANCSTVLTRPESSHRCALRNKPFIQPMSSWVNCSNQAGKAYKTLDLTTAWNTVAKPCSSNPACFSLLSKQRWRRHDMTARGP